MFKTDNKDLFDFSLEQVEEAGWILGKSHNTIFITANIMKEMS